MIKNVKIVNIKKVFYWYLLRNVVKLNKKKEASMQNKISVVAIVVSSADAVENVNSILHDFSSYIMGRMGLPFKDRGVSVITIVVDAPAETLNSMSGKLGSIQGVSSKVLITKWIIILTLVVL